MKGVFERMNDTLKHLRVLHDVFSDEDNFGKEEKADSRIYKENAENLRGILSKLDFDSQLYGAKNRQMILADFIEYIFLGRGYYTMQSRESKEDFVAAILHFVNLLMCYEAVTVSSSLRKKVLRKLGEQNPEIKTESGSSQLRDFGGSVGLKQGESDAPKYLNRYFDSLLPKTAGGLWHELLVYVFLLRHSLGYVLPLLLTQRLFDQDSHIIPPDFLVITPGRNIYGIEVGIRKELQSGSFVLQTGIPTVPVDTLNSRASDRCPICKRWIPFCNFVISRYSKFDTEIEQPKINCLEDCDLYSEDEIAEGKCRYTKYRRTEAPTLPHAQHRYADGLHYHYTCVLGNVSESVRKTIVSTKDKYALKTHYPYYSGLEQLMKKRV